VLRWKTGAWEGISFLQNEKKEEKTTARSRFKDFWRTRFSRPLQTEPVAPYGIRSGRSWEYEEWMGMERKTNAQEKAVKEQVKEKKPGFFRRHFDERVAPRLAATLIWGSGEGGGSQEGA
jgi:hypothetical protein